MTTDPDNTILYSELSVERERVSGGCKAWSIFSSLLSQVAYGPKKSVNLTMYDVNDLHMELGDTAVRCSDDNALAEITTFLVDTKSGSNRVNCDGAIWNIEHCGGYVNVCVNCSLSCSDNFLCADEPFLLSACAGTQCAAAPSAGGHAMFLHLELADRSPPPLITSLNPTMTKTSIEVKLQLSSSGFVHCMVLEVTSPDNGLVTAEAVKLRGVMAAIRENGESGYSAAPVLDNLIPSTNYAIYCLTVSLDGVEATTSDVIAQKQSASTSCCKVITIDLLAPSAKEGEDVFSALSVVFDSAPTMDVVLFLQCRKLIDGTIVYPFFSEAIELISTSLIFDFSVGFRADDPGDYELSFQIAGDSGAEYHLVYGEVTQITVLEVFAEPPPPVVKSVVFSNDGVSVVIRMDSSTDMAALQRNFICSNLFTFVGAGTTKCQWTDSSTVVAYISGESGVIVGDAVSLLPSKLKAECPSAVNCSGWKYSSAESKSVQLPLNPIVPSVVISSPAIIGECDDLTLDLSGSSGAAGRAWKSIVFTVRSTDPNATILAAYLNQNYRITPPTSIPRDLLAPKMAYTFTVSLCNFFGKCSSSSRRVAVSSNVVPVVSLVGPQQITLNRKDSVQLTAEAFSRSCDAPKSFANLEYYWSFYSTDGLLTGSDFESISVNPKKFTLKPNVLTVNRFYYAKVTVLHRISLQASSVTATIFIAQSGIVASIEGGSERSVKLGESLAIDGSGSYDQDTGTYDALAFQWTCVQISPSYSKHCPLAGDLSTSRPVLHVTATESASGTVARITMSVFDSTRRVDRQLDVVSIPPNSPTVLITSRVIKINPNSKLKLSGLVAMESSGKVFWSTSGSSVDLTKISLVPILATVDGITSPSTRSFNLVLAANSLPERSTFTFRLTCVLNTGQSSSAAVTISTNGPPLGGVLTVLPPDGFMLETVFQLLTSRWVDVDIPLTYEFGYYSVGGTLMVLQSQSLKSYTTSTLPAGKDTESFKVSTVVQVFDSLSANSTVSATAVVQAVFISTDELSDMFDATNVEDVDETKKALSTTTSTINAANCTGAPDCEALNRLSCSGVSRTCGVCSESYIGAPGDANTKCVNMQQYRRLLRAIAGDTASDTCDIDSDCSTTAWTSCVDGLCTKLSQNCPQNCNGNGVCLFRDSRDYHVVDACQQGDSNCEGYCLCDNGFAGRSCSVTDTELSKRKSLRVKLLEALKNITISEDASVNSITSWISMLSAVVQQVDELSVSTLVSIFDISEFILIETKEQLLPYDILLILFDVLNALEVADSELSAQDSLEYASLRGGRKVSSLIELLANRVAGDMVAGQGTVSSVQSTMRMSVLRTQPTGSNITLSAPQTPLEGFTGQVAGSVAIHLDSACTATLVDTDAGRWNATSTLQSNPLKLIITSTETTGREDRTVLVVLQNHNTQEYSDNVDNVTVTTTCRAGVAEVINHTCSSGLVISHNCTGRADTISEQCPTVLRRPHCGVVGKDVYLRNDDDEKDGVGDGLSGASSCEVVSYTETNTTCLCRLAAVVTQATGGNSELLERVEEVEVVALTMYVGKSFGSTLAESDEITLAGVRDSLMVIYMYGALW